MAYIYLKFIVHVNCTISHVPYIVVVNDMYGEFGYVCFVVLWSGQSAIKLPLKYSFKKYWTQMRHCTKIDQNAINLLTRKSVVGTRNEEILIKTAAEYYKHHFNTINLNKIIINSRNL